jgi:hypothetical protein
MGFSVCCSVGHGTAPLEKREIVFQMPVVGDPAVADTQDVGGDEIDWLAGASLSHENAGEMAGEAHMRDDAVAHYQPLYNRYLQIWHRGEEPLEACAGPVGPCVRPCGSVWSTKSGPIALASSVGLPLTQKP